VELLTLLLLVLLQTFRPDGSARWQAVSAVHELPEASLLLAKIVRGKGEWRCSARPMLRRYDHNSLA
jgi:hypothetical protein